jgi:hypothetical protein
MRFETTSDELFTGKIVHLRDVLRTYPCVYWGSRCSEEETFLDQREGVRVDGETGRI